MGLTLLISDVLDTQPNSIVPFKYCMLNCLVQNHSLDVQVMVGRRRNGTPLTIYTGCAGVPHSGRERQRKSDRGEREMEKRERERERERGMGKLGGKHVSGL